MQVMLNGRHLWDAIETGTEVRSDNRLALEATDYLYSILVIVKGLLL